MLPKEAARDDEAKIVNEFRTIVKDKNTKKKYTNRYIQRTKVPLELLAAH